jgi:hypothetical protein
MALLKEPGLLSDAFPGVTLSSGSVAAPAMTPSLIPYRTAKRNTATPITIHQIPQTSKSKTGP